MAVGKDSGGVMRVLLAFSALVEIGTGLALMIVPALVLAVLAGGQIADAWLALGRCFGIAILALGFGCWPRGRRTESGAPALWGLLIYNTLIALYLADLGGSGQWKGLLLWPGAALHGTVALLLILAWLGQRRSKESAGR